MARRLRTLVIVAGVVVAGFGAWALNEGNQTDGIGSIVIGAITVLVAVAMRRQHKPSPEGDHTRDYHFEQQRYDIGDNNVDVGGDNDGSDGDR